MGREEICFSFINFFEINMVTGICVQYNTKGREQKILSIFCHKLKTGL